MYDMTYTIHGTSMEIVEFTLFPGQYVQAELGSLIYMGDSMEVKTTTGGGIWKGIKRKLAGETFLISQFKNRGIEKSYVGIGSYYPGRIQMINLDAHQGVYYCQKRAFLCATPDVGISMGFTRRLGAGLFGGEGFILQKYSGEGMVFVHAGGTLIRKTLNHGETIQVDTGCLLGFSATVDYNIRVVSGIMNPLFGGEGLFLAHLKGPGEVLMQSLPFSRLADNLYAAMSDFTSSQDKDEG